MPASPAEKIPFAASTGGETLIPLHPWLARRKGTDPWCVGSRNQGIASWAKNREDWEADNALGRPAQVNVASIERGTSALSYLRRGTRQCGEQILVSL